MPPRSSWLTASRTRRLVEILAAIPARSPGLPVDESQLRLWRFCGGPIDDVPRLVDVLIDAELVSLEHAALRLTRSGKAVVTRRRSDGLRPLGIALLRSGAYYDQARVLLSIVSTEPDGAITCGFRAARQRCPQLVGLLRHWPDVVTAPSLRIPPELAAELQAVWALLPPTATDDGATDAIRKTIGDRGELYSYQRERLAAEQPSDIVWVARDDSNLGYDIEDRSIVPRRRIEVKASGDTAVRFILSDNEWRKAHEDPGTFEVHFWGGVDLNAAPSEEYDRLRAQGYPLVFLNLAALVSDGALQATPIKWRVVQP